MKKIILATLLVALIAAIAIAQHKSKSVSVTVSGKGDAIEEKHSLNEFNAVICSVPMDAVIVEGAENSITIEGQPNIIDAIAIVVENGHLKINYTKVAINTKMRVKATITMTKELALLDISSLGDFYIKNRVSSNSFVANISGSADLYCTNIDSESVTIKVSGMSDITAQGKTKTLDLRFSGKSDGNFENLIAQNVICICSGMGTIKLYASDSLVAKLSGMGTILYAGKPRDVETNVSGMGTIRPI